MSRFNTALAMHDLSERSGQIAAGTRTVPIGTAVIAVLAALATLFANHSSIRALADKNEALLFQTQAADQYNFYESKRVKAELDQGFLDSGTANAAGQLRLRDRVDRANAQAAPILEKAQALETQSEHRFVDSERVMASYESYEISAVVFEIAVVFASITTLTRGGTMLIFSCVITVAGIGFLVAGFLH